MNEYMYHHVFWEIAPKQHRWMDLNKSLWEIKLEYIDCQS